MRLQCNQGLGYKGISFKIFDQSIEMIGDVSADEEYVYKEPNS